MPTDFQGFQEEPGVKPSAADKGAKEPKRRVVAGYEGRSEKGLLQRSEADKSKGKR